MSAEVTTKSLLINPPDASGKAEFAWSGLHRRLDASHAALKRRLTPSPEEKQKILHARAQSLATDGKKEASSPDLSLEVVEFVLGSEHYDIESSHILKTLPLPASPPLPCPPPIV